MKQMLALTRKELKAYFGSPMAAIFIGAFLLVTLFAFFWVETFFARNIADIRPLFRWMPLLLIFLVASLTMRQWSEEQRAGTLEVLLTLPVKLPQLVLGKFLAVLALVALALALTLGLPITVELLGDLDWGPVLGGYLGALLMAAAYIAIGLFVSARTDNQIVALIVTVLLAGLLYLVGSTHLTDFVGNRAGELLRAAGTGSRFASIERGVLDLRDIVYYLSLTALFLAANVLSLDQKRWSSGSSTAAYRRGAWISAGLIAANLLALNVWLQQAAGLRLDITAGRLYSVSPATRDLVANLEEPLLLRGYFSQRTHPLLAPLIPRIRDLMAEYQVVSSGNIEVSFVDPRHDEELEAEANRQYGIKPVPFQVAGRYESAVVNSYFHILVKYGDQHTTLSFNDLIETERRPDGQLEVRLRNLEYDLTKAIKKTVYGFQSLASVFAGIHQDLALTLITTPRSLPAPFAELPARIARVAEELRLQSEGKLAFSLIDPDQAGAGRQELNQRYGIQPLSIPFLAEEPFYLFLFLTMGDRHEPIYITGEMDEAEIRHEIEGALKRNASGFQKTVGLWTPHSQAAMGMMMPAAQGEYRFFQQVLRENYNLEEVDLAGGRVGGDIDVLLLVAPQEMSDLERLAVDQYLMRGGSVVALAGRYLLDIPPGAQSLNLRPVADGILPLLAHYGIEVEEALVMDRQNEPFPIPVSRDLGGFVVREIQQIEYPFFVDVRAQGMDRESPVTANLPAVTMNWVSPVTVNPEASSGRRVSTLLKSSSLSWLYTGTEIQPDFERYPRYGFAVGEPMEAYPLAVTVQGEFDSFFTETSDPRQRAREKAPNKAAAGGSSGPEAPLLPLVRRSPAAARLVVVGSAEFINDAVIGISQSVGLDRYLNSLEFLQNLIDWSVEDEELLTIRSRGAHARLLAPMSGGQETFWEALNYCLALAGLAGVSLAGSRYQRRERPLVLGRENR